MKKKSKIGLESQAYAAPRAESVEVAQQSILCASSLQIEGQQNEEFDEIVIENW